MPPIYDLITDRPDGIGARQVEASSGEVAFEIGRKLFPGCRLAGAMREEEDDAPWGGWAVCPAMQLCRPLSSDGQGTGKRSSQWETASR